MNAINRFTSYSPHFLSLLRFFAGTMFACHGAQKIFGAFGGLPPGSAPAWIVWIAGPLEFFGGVLIALGLFTRPTAFLCSGLMAIAYWYGHGRNAFWPKENGGELAVLYCFIFLLIAASGPGAWALDRLVFRRKK